MRWTAIIALLSIGSGHAFALPFQVAHRNLRNSGQFNGEINLNASRSHDAAECGIPTEVTERSKLDARCPASCPLYVTNRNNDMFCDFTCVDNSIEACTRMNARTPVPDLERGECRRCRVTGCDKCIRDGTDTCGKCLQGWSLNHQGTCDRSGIILLFSYVNTAVIVIVLLAVFFIVWWIADLSCREPANEEALEHALRLRSRAKLHRPKTAGKERSLFPVDTNLCNEDVAGPAVLLHFNFQVAVIIWASVLALVWVGLGIFVDSDMLILGTRDQDSARDACINVKWGFATMHRLAWAKMGYLEFAYLFSFGGAILFGIRQRRLHQRFGIEPDTHADFAAILRGLPEIPGSIKIEDRLQAAVASSTNQRPVGVSVGWQWDDTYTELFEVAIASREADGRNVRALSSSPRIKSGQSLSDLTEAREKMTWMNAQLHKVFIKVEKLFVHPSAQRALARGRHKTGKRYRGGDELKHLPHADLDGSTPLDSARSSILEDDVHEAIRSIKTSSTAFVVFETQKARDSAVAVLKDTPMEFEGKTLRVEVPDFEPSAVIWRNLAPERTMGMQCKRVLRVLGFTAVMIGLLCLFEYWYYHVQLNEVLATGAETMTLAFILMTLMVVIMMAVLCAWSAEVAEQAAVERVGTRETIFVLLYTFSVILQVVLDLVIAWWIGKNLMDVHNVRTAEGKKIEDMNDQDHFVEIFESYAMQKQMGVTVLSFGFPCAFLLPFLLEPLQTVFLPWQLMKLIIRSHPEISRQTAEGYLEPVPMDLGRYGDIMINVIIGALILWFPGGFTFMIFGLLAASHIYIYLWDHYRTLRCVQSIYISSFDADWWAQWMFGIACSIIAAALVFKANCESETFAAFLPTTQLHRLGLPGSHCDRGLALIFKVLLTFFGHLMVHTLMLLFFVPLFSRDYSAEEKKLVPRPYKETAMAYPCSWFSANLIHCLRSEYVYNHDPPFDYCVRGKEHNMRPNEAIGAYFTDKKSEMEDYHVATPQEIAKGLNKRLSRLVSKTPQDE